MFWYSTVGIFNSKKIYISITFLQLHQLLATDWLNLLRDKQNIRSTHNGNLKCHDENPLIQLICMDSELKTMNFLNEILHTFVHFKVDIPFIDTYIYFFYCQWNNRIREETKIFVRPNDGFFFIMTTFSQIHLV